MTSTNNNPIKIHRIVQQPSDPEEQKESDRLINNRGKKLLERHHIGAIMATDLWAAACVGHAPYFDEQGTLEHDDIFLRRFRNARELCKNCPVLTQCHAKLQALPADQKRGIWAGQAYGAHPKEAIVAH